MKLSTPHHTLIRGALALLLAGAAAIQARAEERILKFADPASPGKVVIQMGLGDLHIVGADVKDVKVLSDEDIGGEQEPRDDGLRRLDAGDNHSVSTDGNTIRIVCNGMFGGRHGGGSSDLELTVPKSTHVIVQRAGPGDTQVENLAGDIEMHAAIGDIELAEISGGVLIEAAHGDVQATFTSFPTDRAVSISTANGDVDVRVPEDAKAKVRFRTLRGEILTDFSKDRLVSKMEQAETLVIETEDVSVDVKTELKREQERARAEQERAREEARMAQRAAKDAAEQARRAAREAGVSEGMVPPIPPMPPMPSLPPMAGGKVVTGTLNGGGPDLAITALMGDVTLRKVAK